VISETDAPAGEGDEEAALPALRRSSRWKVLFVALLVTGVLGTATWVLLGSRLLVARHIVVVGERLVPRDRVLAVARVRLGEPLIRLNTGAVRDRVEAVQEVETVRVERRWPATVRIVVRERTPVAAVQHDNRFLQVDRYGVTVLTSAARPRGLPALLVVDPVQTDPSLRAGLAVIGALPPWVSRRVASVEARSPEAVTLRLKEGIAIVWGAPEHAPDKLRLLRGLLSTTPQRGTKTIDVSSPEVVTTE
jgi:cell division protein FtsQ